MRERGRMRKMENVSLRMVRAKVVVGRAVVAQCLLEGVYVKNLKKL
jgi:hypothetical protein